MKKIIKKVICLLISAITFVSVTAACQNDGEINAYVVDGAPLISVCNILDDVVIADKKVKVNVVKDVDALKGAIGRGEADVAVCPVNVASSLYNGGVNFKLLSVNVFGLLHLVGKTNVNLSDLKGQTVYNIGKGGTPDVTFKYVLTANDIAFTENLEQPENDKVNLKYVSSASDLIALLREDVAKFGIMGEPQVTLAKQKAGVNSVIDITEEWSKVNDVSYTQAGVIVSDDLLKSNSKFVKEFFNEMKKTKQYALDNCKNLKSILNNSGSSLNVDFTPEVINSCNLDCKSAYLIKADVNGYLKALASFNIKSIGGKLPDDNFYVDYEKL